jgi:xylulokinase
VDAAPLIFPYLGDGERDEPEVRGAFLGLSDCHGRASLAYAVAKGVAGAVASRIAVLTQSEVPFDELRVAGGGARLAVMGQIKADLMGRPVLHLDADATAVGVAMLAASSAGFADDAAKAVPGSLPGRTCSSHVNEARRAR